MKVPIATTVRRKTSPLTGILMPRNSAPSMKSFSLSFALPHHLE